MSDSANQVQYVKGKPLVSICCISYNHEPYIRDCLEGFMMQKTSFPFEVLIHDDASTDHTADIIREYEAKYPDIIKPIYQTENQYSKGKSIWGEFQFPAAQGKYIALCEGDDFWTDPNKLQIQFDFMESHPDYSMCFHNAYEIIGEAPRSVEDYPTFSNIHTRDYVKNEIIERWIIPTASTFFRKDMLSDYQQKYGKNGNCIFGDIVLFLSAACAGKCRGMEKTMSVYRRLQSGAVFSQKYNHNTIIRHINHYLALDDMFELPSSTIDQHFFAMMALALKKSLFLTFVVCCKKVGIKRVLLFFGKYLPVQISKRLRRVN